MSEEKFTPWMNLFLNLFMRKVSAQEHGNSERESYPWWKAKKRSIQIFYRLFSFQISTSSELHPQQKAFDQAFITQYAGQIQNAILSELGSLRSGSFLIPRVISF